VEQVESVLEGHNAMPEASFPLQNTPPTDGSFTSPSDYPLFAECRGYLLVIPFLNQHYAALLIPISSEVLNISKNVQKRLTLKTLINNHTSQNTASI